MCQRPKRAFCISTIMYEVYDDRNVKCQRPKRAFCISTFQSGDYRRNRGGVSTP